MIVSRVRTTALGIEGKKKANKQKGIHERASAFKEHLLFAKPFIMFTSLSSSSGYQISTSRFNYAKKTFIPFKIMVATPVLSVL